MAIQFLVRLLPAFDFWPSFCREIEWFPNLNVRFSDGHVLYCLTDNRL
jgi:hypothetical protein